MTPLCSPFFPDNCTEEQAKLMNDKYSKMSKAELTESATAKETNLKKKTKEHEAQIKKLEDEFAVYKKAESADIGIMKSMIMYKEQGSDEL